ncbi:MAG: prephenate dehydrogenase/arogenate dehydrogenase family protein, partial [Planctomycetes bacterium]|nr:prephenate dehydrogenase/arogenate dehydrogenase family protein [Planctomycetota bacterium]
MSEKNFESVAIVGVGLLGGSLGLAIKACDPEVRVVGIGHRRASLDEALEIGAIDAASLDPAEGVVGAALVVL